MEEAKSQHKAQVEALAAEIRAAVSAREKTEAALKARLAAADESERELKACPFFHVLVILCISHSWLHTVRGRSM